MSRFLVVVVAAVSLLLACAELDQWSPATETETQSEALVCDTTPIDMGDGTILRVGCDFKQQVYNIVSNGQDLTTSQPIYDSAGNLLVDATHRCGEWILGLDSDGVEVVVHAPSLERRYHNMYHPELGDPDDWEFVE